MVQRAHYSGRETATVLNGNLTIPRTFRGFYDADRDYWLVKAVTKNYNHLDIYPTEEISDKTQARLITDDVEGILLEKLANNGMTAGLKLSQDAVQHLGVKVRDKVVIMGYGSCFGLWKPDDLKKYESSVSPARIVAVLADSGV